MKRKAPVYAKRKPAPAWMASRPVLDEALRLRHTPLMDAWEKYQTLLKMYRLAEEDERRNNSDK